MSDSETTGRGDDDRDDGVVPEAPSRTRRTFLRAAGASAGLAALAGCSSPFGGGNGGETATGTAGDATTAGGGNATTASANGTGSPETDAEPGQIGSGRAGRGTPGGVPMEAMPPLSGELTVYSGRGEALVGELVGFIEDLYPDLTLQMRYAESTELVNQILTEGRSSPADVFFTVNAGALGALAERNRTQQLPDPVLEKVLGEFRDPNGQWVGTSGRARTIPYNTNAFDAGGIPNDIFAFPNQRRFDGEMGWAPSYGSFQEFVTAMRLLSGEQRTRRWLQGMLDSNVQEYSDEFLICQAIADGEISAGFANHYYTLRVLDGNPGAPLDIAFTRNDAGSMFDVAGATVINTTDSPQRATNFIRHLLSAEAQDYFARTTFEYPMIPQVDPVGELPTIDQLNPPQELDLTQLSDLEPTIRLMREVGIDV